MAYKKINCGDFRFSLSFEDFVYLHFYDGNDRNKLKNILFSEIKVKDICKNPGNGKIMKKKSKTNKVKSY